MAPGFLPCTDRATLAATASLLAFAKHLHCQHLYTTSLVLVDASYSLQSSNCSLCWSLEISRCICTPWAQKMWRGTIFWPPNFLFFSKIFTPRVQKWQQSVKLPLRVDIALETFAAFFQLCLTWQCYRYERRGRRRRGRGEKD